MFLSNAKLEDDDECRGAPSPAVRPRQRFNLRSIRRRLYTSFYYGAPKLSAVSICEHALARVSVRLAGCQLLHANPSRTVSIIIT